MDIMQQSLQKHYEWKGKIEVISRSKLDSQESLTLAYTPGVAQPCLEIQKDPSKSFELTPEEISSRSSPTGLPYAIAALVSTEELSADYILPNAFDLRIAPAVAQAVAQAARKTGVAQN